MKELTLSPTDVVITVFCGFLVISIPAGLIYLSGISSENIQFLFGVFIVSLLAALICFVVGAVVITSAYAISEWVKRRTST